MQSFQGDFDEPRPREHMQVGPHSIPRASSVRADSPLYDSSTSSWGSKVEFYLDGVKQGNVVSFDVDQGFMRVFKLGADGKPLIEGDEAATKVLSGKVEVRLR